MVRSSDWLVTGWLWLQLCFAPNQNAAGERKRDSCADCGHKYTLERYVRVWVNVHKMKNLVLHSCDMCCLIKQYHEQ